MPAGQCCPSWALAAYLALAQRNGRELLGELHFFSKLVEISSRVSAWGQHEHQGGGGSGLPEDDREVSGLQYRKLVRAENLLTLPGLQLLSKAPVCSWVPRLEPCSIRV